MCLADDQTHVLIWKLNYPVSITAIRNQNSNQTKPNSKIKNSPKKKQLETRHTPPNNNEIQSDFENESMNIVFIFRCTIEPDPEIQTVFHSISDFGYVTLCACHFLLNDSHHLV